MHTCVICRLASAILYHLLQRLPHEYHKVLVRGLGYLALMKVEGNCSLVWVLEGGEEGEGVASSVVATRS